MKKCKTCEHFQRDKWHKSIDPKEEEQLGGHCEILLKMLQMTNSKLCWLERLHIQESFGCVFHKEGKKK